MRFHYVRYCTLSQVRNYRWNKADGMHNRLENGHGARVTLCANPTHTATDTEVGSEGNFIT
jgi:hypothetical protein